MIAINNNCGEVPVKEKGALKSNIGMAEMMPAGKLMSSGEAQAEETLVHIVLRTIINNKLC